MEKSADSKSVSAAMRPPASDPWEGTVSDLVKCERAYDVSGVVRLVVTGKSGRPRGLNLRLWTSVAELSIADTEITSLTLPSNMPVLVTLFIYSNDSLSSLALPTTMPALESLHVSKTGLVSLTLPDLPRLAELNVGGNRALASLTLPDLPRLAELDVRGNRALASLTLPAMPALRGLDICYNDALKSIVLPSTLPALHTLIIRGNGTLATLTFPVKLSPDLTMLEVYENDAMAEIRMPANLPREVDEIVRTAHPNARIVYHSPANARLRMDMVTSRLALPHRLGVGLKTHRRVFDDPSPKIIASGYFGVVFRAQFDGHDAAIKILFTQSNEMWHEIDLIKDLDGADGAVPRYLGHYWWRPENRKDLNDVSESYRGKFELGQRYLCFAMEFVVGRTLSDCISESDETKKSVVRACALSLSKVHERGVAHRDLNMGNILVTRADAGQTLVVLIDFGLSCRHRDPCGPMDACCNDRRVFGRRYEGMPATQAFHMSQSDDVQKLGGMAYILFTGDFGDMAEGVEVKPEKIKDIVVREWVTHMFDPPDARPTAQRVASGFGLMRFPGEVNASRKRKK